MSKQLFSVLLLAVALVGCTPAIPSPAATSTPQSTSLQSIQIKPGQYTRTNSDIHYNSVRSVAVDPLEGFIWIGYNGGIGTFDGKGWNYLWPAGNVNAIAPTKGGMLFAVDATNTGMGGLIRYNNVASSSTPRMENISHTLPNTEDRLYDIETTAGPRFYSTYTGVVSDTGTVMGLAYAASKPDNIFDNLVHTTLHTKSGDVWVGHIDLGISWWNSTREDWFHVTSPDLNGDIRVLLSNDPRAIVELPDGRVLIGTYGGGLTIYDSSQPEGHQWQTFDKDDGIPERILDIALDKYDRPWIAGLGVAYLTDQGWQKFVVPNVSPGVETTSITFGADCSCVTSSDTVIIGTSNDGLLVGTVPPK